MNTENTILESSNESECLRKALESNQEFLCKSYNAYIFKFVSLSKGQERIKHRFKMNVWIRIVTMEKKQERGMNITCTSKEEPRH